jgi:hypothetical protein
MIDGGGANAVGNEFEGGGLLSMIANAIATPYGSSDRMRDDMQAQRPVMRPADAFAPNAASISPQAQSPVDPALVPFGGPGPNITGPAAEAGMGLDPFGGGGGFIPSQSQVDQEMAMGLGPFGYGGRAIYENAPKTSGMNPSNAYAGPRERFALQLTEMLGPDVAQNFMNSGMGEQAYQSFVANDYNMPNY